MQYVGKGVWKRRGELDVRIHVRRKGGSAARAKDGKNAPWKRAAEQSAPVLVVHMFWIQITRRAEEERRCGERSGCGMLWRTANREVYKTHKRDLVAAAVDAGESPSIANRTEVQRMVCRCRVLAVVLCRRGDENAGDDERP